MLCRDCGAILSRETGRRRDWQRLVEEIVPDFVDPATDGPLSGREDDWGHVTEYRVRLAMEMRDWSKRSDFSRSCINWDRLWAETVVSRLEGENGASSPDKTSPDLRVRVQALGTRLLGNDRNAVRTLAVSLQLLGQIQQVVSGRSVLEAIRSPLT